MKRFNGHLGNGEMTLLKTKKIQNYDLQCEYLTTNICFGFNSIKLKLEALKK